MARGTILLANSSPVATRVLSSLFGREAYTVLQRFLPSVKIKTPFGMPFW